MELLFAGLTAFHEILCLIFIFLGNPPRHQSVLQIHTPR